MQTLCSRCGAPLNCAALDGDTALAGAAKCWCAAQPTVPAQQYATNAACLCAACLARTIDEGVVMYGIPNCDTVKKARAWLDQQGIAYTFWDYKKHGVPQDKLRACLVQHGWQTVCNTRGPTWRSIAQEQRDAVIDAASALALLEQNTSAIKRPIVAWGNTYQHALTVGFDSARWAGVIKI